MRNQGQKNRNNGIRKRSRIPAFFWMALICVLCCGCGKKGSTLLLGESEGNRSVENGLSEEGIGEDILPGGQEAEILQNPGTASGSSQEEKPVEETLIRVYVCGAVAEPGVVEIPAGSRAEDALFAAGGFGQEAAREAVNLADWVSDGQKLYFPAEGEEIPPEVSGEAGGSPGLVNINTADVAALCTLPGVGESRAADIIAWREANGGFGSCEDIMKVPGIKDAMYEKIKDKIAVK